MQPNLLHPCLPILLPLFESDCGHDLDGFRGVTTVHAQLILNLCVRRVTACNWRTITSGPNAKMKMQTVKESVQ